MSVTGLGTRQRGIRLPILALVAGGLLMAAIVLVAVELARFAATRDLLSADITVGAVPVGGLALSEAVKTWDTIYSQPVELDYGDSPILLYPAQIGFFTKDDQMRGQVQSRSAVTNNYWGDFWNYLWQRPATPLDIPLAADYQPAKLLNFLKDVAARYEQRAKGPVFDLSTLTFGSGANGAQIDIETAITQIDQALRRPTNRRVVLPRKSENAKDATMQTLHDAVMTYLKNVNYLGEKGFSLDGPDTAGGISVIDLQSGNEMMINANTAFGAWSTIKIPILLTRFRTLTVDPDKDTKWLMAASILCSSNSASNYLIQGSASSGSATNELFRSGLAQVISTMQTLGAKNTYINAPLYVSDKAVPFSIGAPKTTSDKTPNTHPDPFSQTTPGDMASLLEQMYDCAQYGSGLRAAYPDDYSQLHCKQMIELLSGNKIGRLIELGIPVGTRLAHKNGWGGTQKDGANVSDAGIVFSPGGDYILSVYLWEKKANPDGIGSIDSWQVLEGISQVVYNFFNASAPLMVPRVPENALGAIDCVMPDPTHIELVDLNNINSGRFDANGNILPDACYNYQGTCSPHKNETPVTPPTKAPT